jgi:hypothetical protein
MPDNLPTPAVPTSISALFLTDDFQSARQARLPFVEVDAID